MAAALGGLDLLAFTGGVGEHAPAVRAAGVEGMGFLGIAVDAEADAAAEPDVEVTAAGASVRTFVVAAREDVEIARAVPRARGARLTTGPPPAGQPRCAAVAGPAAPATPLLHLVPADRDLPSGHGSEPRRGPDDETREKVPR